MDFYFSGVRCQEDLEMLAEAGVKRVMINPNQVSLLNSWQGKAALDSGSYPRFRAGLPVDVAYLTEYQQVAGPLSKSGKLDFYVCPDEIGNGYATFGNFLTMRNTGYASAIPVWGWGTDPGCTPETHDLLQYYLNHSSTVGIGGLVPLLRDRLNEKLTKEERAAWNVERRKTLDALLEIIAKWPGRFHLFGLNWLVAIKECKPYARSADSAKWIRAAGQHKYVIFLHSKTRALSQAPARMIPEYAGMDRRQRCIQSAKAIEQFCTGI